jgi:hypothetical protein
MSPEGLCETDWHNEEVVGSLTSGATGRGLQVIGVTFQGVCGTPTFSMFSLLPLGPCLPPSFAPLPQAPSNVANTAWTGAFITEPQ